MRKFLAVCVLLVFSVAAQAHGGRVTVRGHCGVGGFGGYGYSYSHCSASLVVPYYPQVVVQTVQYVQPAVQYVQPQVQEVQVQQQVQQVQVQAAPVQTVQYVQTYAAPPILTYAASPCYSVAYAGHCASAVRFRSFGVRSRFVGNSFVSRNVGRNFGGGGININLPGFRGRIR